MQPSIATQGEFKGWEYWPEEPFESRSGPFYRQVDESGVIGAFRAEERHLNGAGTVHGGCLMTFADFMLFSVAWDSFSNGEMGVTLTCNCEFLSGARLGERVTGRGEVARTGGTIIFVRGTIFSDDRPCLSYSGTIRRFVPRD